MESESVNKKLLGHFLPIGPWRSVHIDDLRRSKDIVSDIRVLRNLAICQLFEERQDQPQGKKKLCVIM